MTLRQAPTAVATLARVGWHLALITKEVVRDTLKGRYGP